MRNVQFGKMGPTISEPGFGSIPIIRLSRGAAVKALRLSYDRDNRLLSCIIIKQQVFMTHKPFPF